MALGLAVIVASAFYSLPALYRGMRSTTATGLSLMSLTVNSVEGGIYFVAGIGLGRITRYGDPVLAYAFFGGLALISNIPRLIRAGYRRVVDQDGSGLPESARQVEPCARWVSSAHGHGSSN